MTRWIALVVLVVFAWQLSVATAQKQAALQQTQSTQPVQRETAEIFTGQKIAEADAALRHHGIKGSFGQAFATTGGPQDSEDLKFYLDEESTFIAVHFHKTTQQIYGITACFKPSKEAGRLNHTYLGVRKITLHPDGSYAVHFEKPTPPKPPAERPKSVYPTFRGTAPVPGNVPGDGRF
jgi:hypothetical protein